MEIVHNQFRFICMSLFIMYLISMTTTASTSRKPIKIWKGKQWIWKDTGFEVFFFNQPYEDKMFITDETCYGDCDISTTREDSKYMKGVEIIYYELKFYKIRLDLAGTFVACSAPYDIKNRPPYYDIKGRNCDKDNRIELYPKPPEDGLDITVSYIFMNKISKNQLSATNKTVGYLPVYSNKQYNIKIFGIASYKGALKCAFFLNGAKLKSEVENYKTQNFCRYATSVSPDVKYAGTYVFQCSAEYLPKKKKKTVKIEKTKTIELKICKDPEIIVANEFIRRVEEMELIFKIHVCSPSTISKVTIKKLKGDTYEDILVRQIYYFMVVGRYEIKFPWLSVAMTGQYKIEAESTKNKKASAIFNLIITEAPKLIAFPERQTIAYGKPASFHCVATGHMLKGIKWVREGKDKFDTSTTITTTETQKNSLGLRMSFTPSHYSHAGWYFCHVWTIHNTHTARIAVEFNVVETNVPIFDPSYYKPPNDSFIWNSQTDDMLNSEQEVGVSFSEVEDEFHRDWSKGEQDQEIINNSNGVLKYRNILIVIAGVCLVITIVMALVVLCVIIKCQIKNRLEYD